MAPIPTPQSPEMDSGKTTLKIRSHNVNGYDSSREFLSHECEDNSFSVLGIQEHWLRPSFRKQKGTNKLKILHPDYDAYATSGMADVIDKRIMKGRPFGGTGFIYHKELSNSIRALVDLKHKRVTVMELNTYEDKIILINAYMPYYNTNNNDDQLIEYRETLGFIENVMISHPHHKFILLMDLNCNIFGPPHPYASLIREMMSKFDLISSFNSNSSFDPARDYTRSDIKRNSYTLIDGIFISSSLSYAVVSSQILHPHHNVSDHLPVELTISVGINSFIRETSPLSNFIPWLSLSSDECASYQQLMYYELCQISIPTSALNHGSALCDNCDCLVALESFYNDIISAIQKADNCLPRRKHGLTKPFWSPELTVLKQKSLDSHILWKDCKCPRSGPVYDEKIRANSQYKYCLRRSKKDSSSSMSNQMSNNLLNTDKNAFWKKWNQLNGGPEPPSSMINGFVNYKDIADTFSSTFKDIYVDSDSNDALKCKFEKEYPSYSKQHFSESLQEHLFTWSDMLNAVFSLKLGKATSTFVKAEHIYLGCPELLCYLHLLFNALISHSYLPHEFLCGSIAPVIKDTNGDTSASSNYRAITLGPIFSQVFEYALFNKFGDYLHSDDLQFGFKSSHSASHAIFALRSCIEYYTKYGSNVFVTFLDCSKAFDTISHYGIFLKLMERSVPLCFLRIIIYLFLNLKSRCQWRGSYTEYFDVLTGTKQGGVISPRIFTMYVDDMVIYLKKRGIGCHIIDLFLACIFYADDLCLLAPTRGAMQEMLDICNEYCREYCLTFNVKKSKSLIFGKVKNCQIDQLTLDGRTIDYVNEWKYLGVTVVAGTHLSFSSKPALASFYRSINSILSVMRKPDKLILMNLLYSNCVPNLTYAADVVEFSSNDMRTCNIALNDAIRRIYSYNRWESTRSLRQDLGFPNVYEIFSKRSKSFLEANLQSSNCVIARLVQIFQIEFIDK